MMSLGEKALIEQTIEELIEELTYRKAMRAKEIDKDNQEYHFGKRVDEMGDKHLINAYKYYTKLGDSEYAYRFYCELRWRYPNTIKTILKDR